MFASEIKEMTILNKFYQAFALRNQLYIYNKRDLFDCIKTANNEKGIFSFATFSNDDHRLIVATLSEKSLCGLQIRDFTFKKDFTIEKIFGEIEDKLECQIGDVHIDDFGERLFVVNGNGIFLKTYSVFDLR
jgi:hypothetical protein